MSPAMKRRIATVLNIASTTFQYGFVPTVIYLGTYILFYVLEH